VYVAIDRKNGGEGNLNLSLPFFRTLLPFPDMQGGKGWMGDGSLIDIYRCALI
jgi:hypothetical protein